MQRQLDPSGSVTDESTRTATTSAISDLDLNELVRMLEDRIVADLDRRGGRYAGQF